MIDAITNQRQARCSLDLAMHVLEVMEGIITSSELNEVYHLKSKPIQPKFLGETEIKRLKV